MTQEASKRMLPISSALRAVGTAVMHAVLVAAPLALLIWVVPRAAEALSELGTAVPQFTLAVIALSNSMRQYFIVAVPGIAVLLALDAALVYRLAKMKRRFTYLWSLVVAILCGLFTSLIVFSVWYPMQSLR